MEVPRCAKEDCPKTVRYRLDINGLLLAYACELSHLKAVMWATRHLGAARLIEPLERRLS